MLQLTIRDGMKSIPVEASILTPDLCGKAQSEIEESILHCGNRATRLGDLFQIEQTDDPKKELLIRGDVGNFHHIGANMSDGNLTIQGNAGSFVGASMSGGEIHVDGNVREFLGSEMRGGRIHVLGQAGDFVGGACPGSKRGMTGGEIFIDKSAGHQAGYRMRRGLISIGESCGDLAGRNMLAGTLIVGGAAGKYYGAEMTRGTIILLGSPNDSEWKTPNFVASGESEPTILRILFRQLAKWKPLSGRSDLLGSYCRWRGDMLALGKGEIFVRT